MSEAGGGIQPENYIKTFRLRYWQLYLLFSHTTKISKREMKHYKITNSYSFSVVRATLSVCLLGKVSLKKKSVKFHTWGGRGLDKIGSFSHFFYFFFLLCPKSCKSAKKIFFSIGGWGYPLPKSHNFLDILGKSWNFFKFPGFLSQKMYSFEKTFHQYMFQLLCKKKFLSFTKSVKVHTFLFFRVRPSLRGYPPPY